MRHARSALLRLVAVRRRLRRSEAALILLAVVAGLAAGAATEIQQLLAHGIQQIFYGVSINRLSALGAIRHPWRPLALPLGGATMILLGHAIRRRARAPVDVVEANALHGGRIAFRDNLVISAQTIVSNGAGASVGLEAAYAQMGGGIASQLGQWLKLRRNDLRILVGAGAGAAVGAAFGAPMTGAFYAFEIVIGNYTPAAIAPVMAACLSATFVMRSLGAEPYLIATTASRTIALTDYLLFALLGLICAGVGIAVMRLVTSAEKAIQGWPRLGHWRPVVGGLILMPIAFLSPQSLSAGHGALHLDLILRPSIAILLTVLALKIASSVISLSFGFRGGLFFASLFLGSLVGEIFAAALNASPLAVSVDYTDAALVGMAALSVSVVGGPMTLALLMLETTHDFALMGVVLTAALVSGAVTRELFGYSFSTWRLHQRGSRIRSPRDIGWLSSLDAGRIMRRDWTPVDGRMTVADFRARVPLGATAKGVLVDEDGQYRGMVPTAAAYGSEVDPGAAVSTLAVQDRSPVLPGMDIHTLLRLFDTVSADELAVVDGTGRVVGVVTEKFARRRYFEEVEAAQRALFGES